MNQRQLDQFGIFLKYHLVAEGELSNAGLMDQPTKSATGELAPAKDAGTVTIAVEPKIRVHGPHNQVPDFTVEPRKRTTPDFTTTAGKRPEADWDSNPRRRI